MVLNWKCRRSVDEILGRGIWVNEITEVVGMGKTHFALSFIAHLLLTTDRSVLFVDSGGQLDPARLHQMMVLRAMGTGISESDIQSKMSDNIRCYPCTDRHEFMAILRNINTELMAKRSDFFSKAIVVIADCLTSILHTGSILEEDSDEAMWEDRAVLRALHVLTSRHVAILVCVYLIGCEPNCPTNCFEEVLTVSL
jgi:RecA/RadA recombinase